VRLQLRGVIGAWECSHRNAPATHADSRWFHRQPNRRL